MMLLAIDSGNSRIKWGIHDQNHWLETGASPSNELTELAQALTTHRPAAIVVSNVAGPAQAIRLEQLLTATGANIVWVEARARECGVENRYDEPAKLGADRFASLIAAKKLLPTGGIVATLGTAITVDMLDADGVFEGGVIAPGLRLMERALFENTRIQKSSGSAMAHPRNTADAVASGIIGAAAGLIERIAAAEGTRACVLAGGDAEQLLPHLDLDALIVDNLVLEGLYLIALERNLA